MKQDDFQRTVKPHRIEREIGDAPSLGHVDRVFGKELPKGMLRRRRRGTSRRGNLDTKKQKLVIKTWSVVFAVVVMVVVVVMLCLRLAPESSGEAAPSGEVDTGKPKPEDPGHGVRVASQFPSPSQDASLSLVKQALMVHDPVKVPEFFRADSATPAEVVVFLENMAATDGPITGYKWLSSMDANGLLIDGVLINTRIGDKPRSRLALLTPDNKGKWRIDFDAFARTVTPSWGEILSGKAGKGVVRILFVRDNYFNGPFGDEAQWTCYRLGSPDIPDDILGYCRKDSPQATALKLILANAPSNSKRKPLRTILEIQRTKGAEVRQFEITRVLAEDWVRSPNPFDESCK